jgi:hypothetical protein
VSGQPFALPFSFSLTCLALQISQYIAWRVLIDKECNNIHLLISSNHVTHREVRPELARKKAIFVCCQICACMHYRQYLSVRFILDEGIERRNMSGRMWRGRTFFYTMGLRIWGWLTPCIDTTCPHDSSGTLLSSTDEVAVSCRSPNTSLSVGAVHVSMTIYTYTLLSKHLMSCLFTTYHWFK